MECVREHVCVSVCVCVCVFVCLYYIRDVFFRYVQVREATPTRILIIDRTVAVVTSLYMLYIEGAPCVCVCVCVCL